MLCHLTGNLGRFVPGQGGHNVRAVPFIKFPTGGGLPLFNTFTAFMWFEGAGKLPSLAPVLLPGRLSCICVFICVIALLFQEKARPLRSS